jgi:hypothetical protein
MPDMTYLPIAAHITRGLTEQQFPPRPERTRTTTRRQTDERRRGR